MSGDRQSEPVRFSTPTGCRNACIHAWNTLSRDLSLRDSGLRPRNAGREGIGHP